MGQGHSKHGTYPVSPGVGHAGICPFCSGTTPDSDEPESSSTSLGKRTIDDYDITESIFMIVWGLLGMLLLIAAFIAWRRRNREISVIENEVLHTIALSAQDDLESGNSGKTTINIEEEAPPAYHYD